MLFSPQEQHIKTLEMLTQVRDYIASWPAHPMNKEILALIDQHLHLPHHHLLMTAGVERSCASFTPSGLCQVRARLNGHALNISIPDKPECADDESIIQALRLGITLDLKPTP